MKKILILIISITLSCSSDDGIKTSEINIRLSNVSQFDFQNIILNTTTGNVNFENICSGEKTNYKRFQTAYPYGFVELQIDGEIYTLQPSDYVGETPLKNGIYTYVIDASDSQEQYGKLSLMLIEE